MILKDQYIVQDTDYILLYGHCRNARYKLVLYKLLYENDKISFEEIVNIRLKSKDVKIKSNIIKVEVINSCTMIFCADGSIYSLNLNNIIGKAEELQSRFSEERVIIVSVE